ncbi:MAG: DUF2142 domain-containing protein [Anaerolineaceae bacterium]|nr:DUF2142 domain-containing protein [Anaerolineaceae bacterium]
MLRNSDTNTEAGLFLKLAAIVGLLLVILNPPMCSPDENTHFLNAYAVSTGDLFPDTADGLTTRIYPESVLSFVDTYNSRFAGNYSQKYSFGEMYFDGYLPYSRSEPDVIYQSGLTAVSFVSYLPAAFGMMAGRLAARIFGMEIIARPYNLLLFGRLGNLFFYIAVTFLALKTAVCYRRLMLILALMPMSIYLGASVNYDALLIPVSFLFVAEVMKLIRSEADGITKSDICCILFCVFLITTVKIVYATLFLLLLGIPVKKYGTKKRMLVCVLLVFVTIFIACIPQLYMQIRAYHSSAGSQDPSLSSQQIDYVRHHPGIVPYIFYNTLVMSKSFYIGSFWGNLGQLDTNIPLPFCALFYTVLLIAAIIDSLTAHLWDRQWKRILPGLAVFVCVAAIFGVMYVSWTPLPGVADGVGSSYVSGVQGRYFIELFIPAVSIFASSYGKRRAKKESAPKEMETAEAITAMIARASALGCSVLTPLIIFLRYW